MKPLVIDLYAGLGGWAEGFLAEGYEVVGFDVERHDYGTGGYPGQLVIQDVLTLHGSQFRNAAVIVASPPCQAYSYRAMPWKRAKALPPPSNELFDACFRIQREACEAAGRYIPLVVENVKGAQPWVGSAAWHNGSYYLWGDVPALMPHTFLAADSVKVSGINWSDRSQPAKGFNMTAIQRYWEGVKQPGHSGRAWFADPDVAGHFSSKSSARKAASAQIAKIPFPLAQHIARVYKPADTPPNRVAGLESPASGILENLP